MNNKTQTCITGVGFVLRKVASTLKPMFQVIRHADDEYTFISKSTFKTSEFRFKLGEKFKETRMDGVVCDVSAFLSMIRN